MRGHVETLRRLKYRPTGGFAAFALADPAPGATAALLDHERVPKPAWAAFVAACAPVIAVIDELPTTLRAGRGHHLELHVVNDLRHPVEDLTASVTMTWEGRAGEPVLRRAWTGAVAADSVERIGVLDLTVPAPPSVDGTGPATLLVALELTRGGERIGCRLVRRAVTPRP